MKKQNKTGEHVEECKGGRIGQDTPALPELIKETLHG